MQNILKRPMFRKGGLTQRSNYEIGGPTSEDVLRQYEFLKESLPQQKDDRFIRYLSRAGNQLGQKPQGGTTALQRIINAASGSPLEQLFAETDERRKYDQGLQSLALERALGEFDRARKMEDDERLRQTKMNDELETYRKKLEIQEDFGGSDKLPSDLEIKNSVIADMQERGLEVYDEDGRPTLDFQRELKFTRDGIYAINEEERTLDFPLSNIAGDRREMDASIAINQAQKIKQLNANKALDAGLDIATVDFYDPSINPKSYVLYIAEEGVEILDVNDPENMMEDPNNPGNMIIDPNGKGKMITVPGSAYLYRVGDEIKILDINFNEIPTE